MVAMRHFIVTVIGRLVRFGARLRGGGSALPGLVVERLDAGYLARVLADLPAGVVAISGTNGKTTTTKMVVELLQSQGFKVFTNKTGSNFSRGIIAAALGECDWRGKLDADIAVLELDEAHAMHVIDKVQPRYTLLLNVLRDQLDRFGELDATAQLLRRLGAATTQAVVVNQQDPLLAKIGAELVATGAAEVVEFGVAPQLRELFPSDQDLHAAEIGAPQHRDSSSDATALQADVVLQRVAKQEAAYLIDGQIHQVTLQLDGLYNLFNAAAALALVRAILRLNGREAVTGELLGELAQVQPAFGRGEKLTLDGQPLELVLVKNPAGFRLGLASFDPAEVAVMIAINDQYADGRDMSWLWDVDFSSLAAEGVDTVSGVRAWDMTLRLEHDDVYVRQTVPNLAQALSSFRAATSGKNRRIYCTYTAMLELREKLAELTEVENIW